MRLGSGVVSVAVLGVTHRQGSIASNRVGRTLAAAQSSSESVSLVDNETSALGSLRFVRLSKVIVSKRVKIRGGVKLIT